MNTFRTAVVVLNYKDHQTTIKNVDQLLQTVPDLMAVVVDNDSPNGSFDILSSHYAANHRVHVFETGHNGGYSFGNNFGVDRVLELDPSIQYIAIMNPDVRVEDPEIFNTMLSDFDNESIGVIAPLMVENGQVHKRSGWMLPTKAQRIFANTPLSAFFRPSKPQILGDLRIVDAIHGSFFIVSRKVFGKTPLFDDNIFLYGEESVLAFKVKTLCLKEAIDTRYQYVHEHNYATENREASIRRGRTIYQSVKYLLRVYYKCTVLDRLLYILFQGTYAYIYLPLLLNIKNFHKR